MPGNTPKHRLTVTAAAALLGVARTSLSRVLSGRKVSRRLLGRYQQLLLETEGRTALRSHEESLMLDIQRRFLAEACNELSHNLIRRDAMLKLRQDFAGLVDITRAFSLTQPGYQGMVMHISADPNRLAIDGANAVDLFVQTQEMSLRHRVRDAARALRPFNPEGAAYLEEISTDVLLSAREGCKLLTQELLKIHENAPLAPRTSGAGSRPRTRGTKNEPPTPR